MEMKIAVPLDREKKVYRDTPWTAPYFAIYRVTEDDENLIYDCVMEKENPKTGYAPAACADDSSDAVKTAPSQIPDHRTILESLHGCRYLVAETYCSNLEKELENSNIELYQLPPIVKNPDLAVKNLLVNLKYTDNVQKVIKAL